jgi:peroxiredoxin
MNRRAVLASSCLAAALVGVYARARFRTEPAGNDAQTQVLISGGETHRVTPEMAEGSRERVGTPAPGFEADGSDGRRYALDAQLRRGPVVLTFIKEGCPCSEAAQPFFNAVRDAYPKAAFLGVIDVDPDAARRWAGKFGAAYPLLTDRSYRIVRDYGAENSAYVVVVGPDGRIQKHWPGFSSDMLRELGATLAALTGAAEAPLNVADAPDTLYSGCPYDLSNQETSG